MAESASGILTLRASVLACGRRMSWYKRSQITSRCSLLIDEFAVRIFADRHLSAHLQRTWATQFAIGLNRQRDWQSFEFNQNLISTLFRIVAKGFRYSLANHQRAEFA